MISRSLWRARTDGRTAIRNPEAVAGALRERIYATLTGVATLMLLLVHVEEESATSAVVSLVVAMGTLWLASLVSEFIAHGITRREEDDQETIARTIFQTAGQSLELMVTPIILIVLSPTGLWSLRTALILAVASLMATLIAASIYAVRRSALGPIARLLIVLIELGLGVVVIVAKVLAH